MSFKEGYTCDRCKREITGSSVILTIENQAGVGSFKDGIDLCGECFAVFMDWVKNSGSGESGPVERVARREASREAGPVERVARDKLHP